MGCAGACIIILTSATAGNAKRGQHPGRSALYVGSALLCALSLTLQESAVKVFPLHHQQVDVSPGHALHRPFTIGHVSAIPFAEVPMSTWWETGYVIFFGTFVAYICMMIGQKTLRPTVVSVYNYVQPLVSVSVSVIVGLAVFKGMQAIAALLVFSGVWLVVKSKSKHDIDKHDHSLAYEKRHA